MASRLVGASLEATVGTTTMRPPVLMRAPLVVSIALPPPTAMNTSLFAAAALAAIASICAAEHSPANCMKLTVSTCGPRIPCSRSRSPSNNATSMTTKGRRP